MYSNELLIVSLNQFIFIFFVIIIMNEYTRFSNLHIFDF
jgi:hypothetical protein